MKDMQEPEAKSGEVVVRLKTAGINRRDLGLLKRYGDNPEALVIGSDGAGIIEKVGEGVANFSEGESESVV